ncbi:hypothetical protein [Paludisphaera soli]|uniref:hypothetical protein n=1 Tax=Paludisphaera soli TaxID=2712865 RepID=UPI0013EBC993|nr:hypothetical protein [Paludisphaera soli]
MPRSPNTAATSAAGSIPVDHNPYQLIRDPTLSEFERTGVAVAVLVHLATGIDNATWEDAFMDQGRRLRLLIRDGLLDEPRQVRSAAASFLESEAAFLDSLKRVFDRVVRPHVEAPPS